MVALAVVNPLPQFFELDGDPLDNGAVFFGTVGGNPVTSPATTVTWDDGTPVSQPATTKNGYFFHAGRPSVIKVDGDYSMLVRDKRGRVVFYLPNSAEVGNAAALQQLILGFIADLANALDPNKGAALVGFKYGLAYPADTVGDALNKALRRVAVIGTGIAATDNVNLQAAITAASDYQTIELFGTFTISVAITVKPKLKLLGNGCTIMFTNVGANLFQYLVGTPIGFPGRIVFEHIYMVGPGNTGNCAAIKIDANSPFILIQDCYIRSFKNGIFLRDTYCSKIVDTHVVDTEFGIQLFRECHATILQNCFVETCTIAALAVNYGGGAGTGPSHNVQVIGGAYQTSTHGIWIEQALEFHTTDVYHEGNTNLDYRIGVADAGAYLRACYNVVIDHSMSTSPVATSGKNIVIEHSVSVTLRSMAWDNGSPTATPHVETDTFCGTVWVDYQRLNNATTPFNFLDPVRVVVSNNGRVRYPSGMTSAIEFGSFATKLGRINQGLVPVSGRNALTIESLVQDLQIRAAEIIRFQRQSDGALVAAIDCTTGALPTASPGAGSKQIWVDTAASNVLKIAL